MILYKIIANVGQLHLTFTTFCYLPQRFSNNLPHAGPNRQAGKAGQAQDGGRAAEAQEQEAEDEGAGLRRVSQDPRELAGYLR
jgi:hypothetical protein